MNIAYHKLGINVELNENKVNVIVIENPRSMAEMIYDLNQQNLGNVSEFVIAENDKTLNFNHTAAVIFNPVTVDCNEKKILNKLYSEISAEAKENFYEKTNLLNSNIIKYMDELLIKVPYPVTYSENLDIADFLKAVNVCIDDCSETFLEKITNYIKIIASLNNIKVVFMLNIKSYLDIKDIEELYKEARYNKIFLVLIENIVRDKIENEDILIIDKDLCTILIK